MKRKKVVFFIESFSGGGAERVLLTIMRNIDRQLFDVTVLVMSNVGVYKEDFASLGINVVSILSSGHTIYNSIKYKLLYSILPSKIACRWITRGIKADTYVAFVEGYCTRIFAQLPKRCRKIAWLHIDLKKFPWTLQKGIYKSLEEEKSAYGSFSRTVGVSEAVTDVLRCHFNVKDATTIYNPIDETRIKELSLEPCAIDVNKANFNIVSVGRLTKQKGYDLLIERMVNIVNRNPEVKLFIIGEGEERANLETLISQNGLGNSVRLVGFLENPYSLMSKMDLFVCSSRAEGFSLVIAEAMIIGLPVVSMNCAGPNELLGGGKYGILCESFDALEHELLELSNNPERIGELSEKSKARATFFDTQRILKEIESIL